METNPPALTPVLQSVFKNAWTWELTPVVMAPALIPIIRLTVCPEGGASQHEADNDGHSSAENS